LPLIENRLLVPEG
jgi:sulfite reductase alpha subunit-like flavoprotein